MLKLYLWVVLVIFILCGNFGFVLPYLISAAHTELVLLGCVIGLFVPVALIYIIKYKIKPIVKEMIEKATKGEI